MTSEIPSWIGYVVGGGIFCLAGVVLLSILVYALRESKRVAEQEARQRDQRRLTAIEETTTGINSDSHEDRERRSEQRSQDDMEPHQS